MHFLDTYLPDIRSLCQKHKVDTCYLFGSAVDGRFNDKSDIDFLVRFRVSEITDYFSNYLRLKESLTELLGCDVDLIEEQSSRNPILMRSIDRAKSLVFSNV